MLRAGQELRAELNSWIVTVRSKLGEGGQGCVSLVDTPVGQRALKWYNPEQSTEDQKDAIRYLVRLGPPPGPPGQRFVWPEDLVARDRSFGYLMKLIDTSRFAQLGEVWAGIKPAPGLGTLCVISQRTANSYRALHLTGHCYRDISKGNLMFDPLAGDVLICDNDNVGIDRQSRCQVWGTLEFMAPELVRGDAQPSTTSDLHSLAVLLFNLWVWHHPFHGLLEYQFHSWDLPAKIKVYGTSPLFIFDPNDSRNRLPEDPEYRTAAGRWELCPPSLQALFTNAFTIGVHDPGRRVTEGEWQRLFQALRDGQAECPKCRAENLWDGQQSLACWHCRDAIPLPPRLRILSTTGSREILLFKDAVLSRRHFDAHHEGDEPIGVVVRNEADPRIWGIRNLTAKPWIGHLQNGTSKTYAPQKSVPLSAGLVLSLEGATAEIVPSP